MNPDHDMSNGEAVPPASSQPPGQKSFPDLEKHKEETIAGMDNNYDDTAGLGEKSPHPSPQHSSSVNQQDNEREHDDHINELAAIEATKSISATLSPVHEFFVILIIICSQLFTQVALNECLVLNRQIAKSFDIDSPAIESWFIAGYSLTVGTFILFSGRLGDAFGYKPILVIGYAWFALWNVVVGLSIYSNHVLFIWARVLSGIGPALCLPNALAILGATYPPGKKKNMLFSLFGAAAPDGGVLGMTLGGLFNLAWWPWTFWFTGMVLACLAAAAHFVLPDVPRRRSAECNTFRTLFFDLDIPGTVVGVVGLVLFNFAWNQAPLVGWDTAQVIVTLVLGLAFIGAFCLIEVKFAKAPLIPFEALTSDASFVLAMIVCGWACFGIWLYYLVQTVQVLQGGSPLLSAAKLSPVVISGSTAAVTTGFVLHRLGPPLVMCLALVCFTVGVTLLATVPIDQTYWAQMFVATLITPFGMDMSFPAATLILSNLVSHEHQGVAASLVNTLVNYSISIGLGVAGTIEVHVNNGGKTLEDTQKGFRGAMYFGIGVAGLGVGIGIIFLSKTIRRKRLQAEKDENGPLESATTH